LISNAISEAGSRRRICARGIRLFGRPTRLENSEGVGWRSVRRLKESAASAPCRRDRHRHKPAAATVLRCRACTYGADEGLVTSGLYRYSRNPQYVASILGFLGTALANGEIHAAILCGLAILVYVIRRAIRNGDGQAQRAVRLWAPRPLAGWVSGRSDARSDAFVFLQRRPLAVFFKLSAILLARCFRMAGPLVSGWNS